VTPQKKGDGLYAIRWLEPGPPERYRQETLRGVTYQQARTILKRRVFEASNKRGLSYAFQPFRALVARYLAIKGPNLSPGWKQTVEGYLRLHILPALGDRIVETLKAVDLEEYRNRRREQRTANCSINHEIAIVLAILRFAEASELIDRNPIPRGRIRPLPEQPRTAFFSREDWQRFSNAFNDSEGWNAYQAATRRFGPVVVDPEAGTARRYGGGLRPGSEASEDYRKRLKAAMDVFRAVLLTGSRIGEILTLTWDRVDLQRNAVRIYQSKAKRDKTIPLTAALREVLLRQPRGIGAAPVFQRPGGGPWDSARIEKAFRLARQLSGIRGELTIHSLRHTAASWLTIEGTPERFVRDYLGHSDVAMTARYSHLTVEHLRGAAETIERLSKAEPA
jgi:integrase